MNLLSKRWRFHKTERIRLGKPVYLHYLKLTEE